MNKMGLSSQTRSKRNYSSYKGQVGKLQITSLKERLKGLIPVQYRLHSVG